MKSARHQTKKLTQATLTGKQRPAFLRILSILTSALAVALAAFALGVFALVFGAVMPAQAQTYTVLYNFGTNPGGPVLPGGGPDFIAQGRDGNLYSTSRNGGSSIWGAAFKITPSGTLTVLTDFSFPTNGGYPYSGLNLGTDGNLYGTTSIGGDLNCNAGYGCGTVIKITPGGALTTLFAFPGDESKGAFPDAAPIQGTDGNFYGTTPYASGYYGSVYKLTPTGTLTTLHQCTADPDCNHPNAGLVQGTDGKFYGGSQFGGTSNGGMIFKITSAGVFSVLHNCTGAATDCNGITIGLIQGSDGNFYGVTGPGTSNAGVVFKITSRGTYTVLYNLNGTTDGNGPSGSLVQATDGNFYGVTNAGGTLGFGTIYTITPQGAYSVVHNFDDTHGSNPQSRLTQNTNGILYGDTSRGGSSPQNCNGSCGVFYSLDIGATPFARLALTSGKVGVSVGIFGQGFLTATGVTFGGTAATFTTAGDNYMTATVPAGGKTGPVVVLIPSGNLTNTKTFKVLPAIASFTPSSGPVGTVVTITGSGLTQATKVTFNKVVASFTVNSDSKITATVPTGATTGKIAVTTKGGSASSKTSFTVT